MKLPAKKLTKDGKQSFLTRFNRFMWTKLPTFDVAINVPDSNDGSHQRVMLAFSKPYGNFTVDLTALTSVELAALRETLLIATDVARPVVESLDQKARDNELNGDDSDIRLYRGIPVVVVRKGALRAYSEGLLLGREDVLQRIGTQFGSAGPAPEGGVELDNSNEEECSTLYHPTPGSESV